MEYVKKLKSNPIAKVVKLADLKHNSDLTRLGAADEKALKRVEKYKRAMEELLKAVADRSNITLKTSQYCLIGSTLRSYLSGLYETGKITYTIEENRMIWKSIY